MVIIKEILSHEFQTVEKGASLYDAVLAMEANNNGVTIILEEAKILGIITERDIVTSLHSHDNLSRPALEYATKNIITVHDTRHVEYALHMLIDHNIRRLVVVDADGLFQGVLVQESILQHLEKETYRVELKISNLIQQPIHVISLQIDDTLQHAIDLMYRKKISSVLIKDTENEVGIITERDTLRLIHQHIPMDTLLQEVMTSPLISISEHENVAALVELMETRKIRRLVVTNNNAKVIGIISTRDILRNIKGSYGAFLEDKLRHSQRTLNSIHNCILTISELNNQYIVQWANTEAKKVFGTRIIDENINKIIPTNQWSNILVTLKKSQHISKERILYNNQKFDISFDLTYFENMSQVRAIFKDVTAYEQAIAQEVQNRLEKEQLLYQQAKLASIGEMTGMIAHQWRQPLSAISLISQNVSMLHEDDELDDTILTQSCENINNQVTHMQNTMQQFLNFFKPNQTQVTFEIEDIFQDTLALLSAKLKTNHIDVEHKFTLTHPIKSYKNELTQVILNLMSNAIDALNGKNISKPIIYLGCFETNKEVCITVEDNAKGIEEYLLEEIFTPYFSTKKEKGTGIGLYMSRMLIEGKLQGKISAKNTERGLKFTIKL